jgi:hypothetical protein
LPLRVIFRGEAQKILFLKISLELYIFTVMRKLLLTSATLLILLLLSWQQQAQKANPYGLQIVSTIADYKNWRNYHIMDLSFEELKNN